MVIKKRVQKEVGGILRKEWKCVESRIDSKCLYYGRFILSPLPKGQGDTIGITMRRVLLGEIKGTSITRAKLNKIQIFHEYGRIVGLEEPIYEILENLKQIVLRSFTNRILKASIRVRGPGCITAKDMSVSPFVQIVDTTQYIATLTKPIDLSIELQIERDRGYRVKHKQNFQDGSYPIDAVFMPVRAVNYTIHNCQNENEDGEILFLEIWTNGSLTPREALREASRNSIELFMPFLYPEKTDILLKKKKQTFMIPPLIFQDRTSELKFWEEIEEFKKETDETIEELNELRKKNKKLSISWDSLFIDQLELSSETYYCLLRSERRTLLDIINTEPKDFFKIPNFRTEYLVELNFTMAKILKCLVILYQDQTPK